MPVIHLFSTGRPAGAMGRHFLSTECFNVVGIYSRVVAHCERCRAQAASPLRTHQPRYYMRSQALTGITNAAFLHISLHHTDLMSTCLSAPQYSTLLDLLLFLILRSNKLNIFRFWTVGETKEAIWGHYLGHWEIAISMLLHLRQVNNWINLVYL